MDVRTWAAIAATLLLIGGVMWVVPTTPESNSFTFDPARRGISNARSIALNTRIEGTLVDGSDTDFYKIDPVSNAVQLEVRFMNGSTKLIPAIRVFDGAANLVIEKADEYVRSPGVDIDFSIPGQPNMAYYLQVFSQRNTTGPYALTVTERQP
jgi:hypothetical protein